MRPWRKCGQRLLDVVLVLSEQTYIDLSLRYLSQCAHVAVTDVTGSHYMMCGGYVLVDQLRQN
jgi:hypothetical protein